MRPSRSPRSRKHSSPRRRAASPRNRSTPTGRPLPVSVNGSVNGLDRLAEATWLGAKTLYYWGDIDTHGSAILDRLRAFFPYAQIVSDGPYDPDGPS